MKLYSLSRALRQDTMMSNEIRHQFLDFFRERGHRIVPSSSLIPDDPSVLLTTAGMQQFKKYYTGDENPIESVHPNLGEPLGLRSAASIQKSFRTSDIDEVGDESHLTFFEMLGNFSFGGYFKEDAIRHAYEFFQKIGLAERINFVTVFEGEGEIPPDEESEKIWKKLGVARVERRARADNFWGPTGKEGPCGPTTEMYVDDIEIWNIVFNEYYQNMDGSLRKLDTSGVDTGMGLERLAMVLQKKKNIFETDLFSGIIGNIGGLGGRSQRIVADHMRGIVFLIGDGVISSNKDQGYILRRLTRRVAPHLGEWQALQRFSEGASIPLMASLKNIAELVIDQYGAVEQYSYLRDKREAILTHIEDEYRRFRDTYGKASKILNQLIARVREQKADILPGKEVFDLVTTYGLSLEWIKDVAKENALHLDVAGFEGEFKKHQEISRAGKERKFGGHGLILDTGELKAKDEEELKKVTRLHTATHLLQAALRKVLGPEVRQMGSDITRERTRFDFTFGRKLTSEEIRSIEDIVNEEVRKSQPVTYVELPIEEAKKTGALYFFKEKYPPFVKVYSIGGFSKEFCNGPHVANTTEIGRVVIMKEEAVAAGVRRIRARVLP